MFAKANNTFVEPGCTAEIVRQCENSKLPSDCEHGLTYCNKITSSKDGFSEVLGENDFLFGPLPKSAVESSEFILFGEYRVFVQIEDKYMDKNIRLSISEGKIVIELDAR